MTYPPYKIKLMFKAMKHAINIIFLKIRLYSMEFFLYNKNWCCTRNYARLTHRETKDKKLSFEFSKY